MPFPQLLYHNFTIDRLIFKVSDYSLLHSCEPLAKIGWEKIYKGIRPCTINKYKINYYNKENFRLNY